MVTSVDAGSGTQRTDGTLVAQRTDAEFAQEILQQLQLMKQQPASAYQVKPDTNPRWKENNVFKQFFYGLQDSGSGAIVGFVRLSGNGDFAQQLENARQLYFKDVGYDQSSIAGQVGGGVGDVAVPVIVIGGSIYLLPASLKTGLLSLLASPAVQSVGLTVGAGQFIEATRSGNIRDMTSNGIGLGLDAFGVGTDIFNAQKLYSIDNIPPLGPLDSIPNTRILKDADGQDWLVLDDLPVGKVNRNANGRLELDGQVPWANRIELPPQGDDLARIAAQKAALRNRMLDEASRANPIPTTTTKVAATAYPDGWQTAQNDSLIFNKNSSDTGNLQVAVAVPYKRDYGNGVLRQEVAVLVGDPVALANEVAALKKSGRIAKDFDLPGAARQVGLDWNAWFNASLDQRALATEVAQPTTLFGSRVGVSTTPDASKAFAFDLNGKSQGGDDVAISLTLRNRVSGSQNVGGEGDVNVVYQNSPDKIRPFFDEMVRQGRYVVPQGSTADAEFANILKTNGLSTSGLQSRVETVRAIQFAEKLPTIGGQRLSVLTTDGAYQQAAQTIGTNNAIFLSRGQLDNIDLVFPAQGGRGAFAQGLSRGEVAAVLNYLNDNKLIRSTADLDAVIARNGLSTVLEVRNGKVQVRKELTASDVEKIITQASDKPKGGDTPDDPNAPGSSDADIESGDLPTAGGNDGGVPPNNPPRTSPSAPEPGDDPNNNSDDPFGFNLIDWGFMFGDEGSGQTPGFPDIDFSAPGGLVPNVPTNWFDPITGKPIDLTFDRFGRANFNSGGDTPTNVSANQSPNVPLGIPNPVPGTRPTTNETPNLRPRETFTTFSGTASFSVGTGDVVIDGQGLPVAMPGGTVRITVNWIEGKGTLGTNSSDILRAMQAMNETTSNTAKLPDGAPDMRIRLDKDGKVLNPVVLQRSIAETVRDAQKVYDEAYKRTNSNIEATQAAVEFVARRAPYLGISVSSTRGPASITELVTSKLPLPVKATPPNVSTSTVSLTGNVSSGAIIFDPDNNTYRLNTRVGADGQIYLNERLKLTGGQSLGVSGNIGVGAISGTGSREVAGFIDIDQPLPESFIKEFNLILNDPLNKSISVAPGAMTSTVSATFNFLPAERRLDKFNAIMLPPGVAQINDLMKDPLPLSDAYGGIGVSVSPGFFKYTGGSGPFDFFKLGAGVTFTTRVSDAETGIDLDKLSDAVFGTDGVLPPFKPSTVYPFSQPALEAKMWLLAVDPSSPSGYRLDEILPKDVPTITSTIDPPPLTVLPDGTEVLGPEPPPPEVPGDLTDVSTIVTPDGRSVKLTQPIARLVNGGPVVLGDAAEIISWMRGIGYLKDPRAPAAIGTPVLGNNQVEAAIRDVISNLRPGEPLSPEARQRLLQYLEQVLRSDIRSENVPTVTIGELPPNLPGTVSDIVAPGQVGVVARKPEETGQIDPNAVYTTTAPGGPLTDEQIRARFPELFGATAAYSTTTPGGPLTQEQIRERFPELFERTSIFAPGSAEDLYQRTLLVTGDSSLAYQAYKTAAAPRLEAAYFEGYIGSAGGEPLRPEQREVANQTFAALRAQNVPEAEAAAQALAAGRAVLPPAPPPPPPSDLQTLKAETTEALRVATESGNPLGKLLATVVLGVTDTALERARGSTAFVGETSAVAAALKASGQSFSQLMQLVGRGDLAAFGAVIGDLGQVYKDANIGNTGMTVGSGFRTIGDALLAVGRTRNDQGLVFTGTVLAGVGDVIRGASDATPGTANAAGLKLAGSLATLLGGQSNSAELQALGVALTGAPEIASLFNSGKTDLGNAALAETASTALGLLAGGKTGETIANIGALVGTGFRIAANTTPGGAGSLYVTAARQVLDLVGVKLDGATNFALGAASAALASNPIGWAVFGVGALFNLFGMGSFSKTQVLQENIDADGDGRFDDIAKLKEEFRRGFFGGVSLKNHQILYDVNGVDQRLLQSVNVTLTPETKQGWLSYQNGWDGDESYFQFEGLRGKVVDANGSEVGPSGILARNNGGRWFPEGPLSFVADDGQRFGVTTQTDDGGTMFYVDQPTGNTFLKISANYASINPSTVPINASQTWTLNAADAAVWRQAIGGEDSGMAPGDARLAAGGLLATTLEQMTAQYQGQRNDPNLYVYMDMNGDGTQDQVRIGLQIDGLKQKGDGKVGVTLMDASRQPIAQTYTANNFAEAEEIGRLAPALMSWGLTRPGLWDRAIEGITIKDWNAGSRPVPDLGTFYYAARDNGHLPWMQEAEALTGQVLANLLSGQPVDLTAAFTRLDELSRALGSAFDAEAYMARYPDVAAWAGNNGLKAAQHYAQWGNAEGRAVNAGGAVMPVWNPQATLQARYDARPVTLSIGNVQQYGGWDEGYTYGSGLFVSDPQRLDGNAYSLLPDVPLSAEPRQFNFGNAGDQPRQYVSMSYTATNGVKAILGGDNVTLAANDPRIAAVRTLLWLESEPLRALAYIASHGDLIAAFGNNPEAGVRHYAEHGWRENRGVSFDVGGYLAANPDVAAATNNNAYRAINHYFEHGRFEGRVLAPGQAPQVRATPALPPPGVAVLGAQTNVDMAINQALLSPDGRFMAIMQSDGNFVVYDQLRGGVPIWATGTDRKAEGGILAVQGDGNLVVYQPGGRARWSSDTYTQGVARSFTLALQNDGNLVLYDTQGGEALWSIQTGRIGRPEQNAA